MKNASSKISKHTVHRSLLGIFAIASVLLIISFTQPLLAQVNSPSPSSKDAILQQARSLMDQDHFRQAISLLESNSQQYSDEVRFPLYLAEAYYGLANDAKASPYYEKTESYAQRALHMENRPEAHYWYGLALLKKAEKQGGVGAIAIVKDGIRELNLVRETAPTYDHAGASRVLSQLYARAPRWTPFGDRDKAVSMAQEAVRLAPDYPENRKVLEEAQKR